MMELLSPNLMFFFIYFLGSELQGAKHSSANQKLYLSAYRMATEENASAVPGKHPRDEPEAGSKNEASDVAHESGKSGPAPKAIRRSPTPDSSSDDDLGPALPSTAPPKKKRKLPYEKLYISALPKSPRYSKSLMHKDQLCFVTMTPSTEFLITSSTDGVVKFWKKVATGIEFVKEFKAHNGEIRCVSVSPDGRSFATAGTDKTIKLFDVVTFGRPNASEIPKRERESR
jgi:hypothetical protein